MYMLTNFSGKNNEEETVKFIHIAREHDKKRRKVKEPKTNVSREPKVLKVNTVLYGSHIR